MGCNTAKLQSSNARRRLSVENVDGGKDDPAAGTMLRCEDDQKLLAQLGAEQLLDMYSSGSHRYCIFSQTEQISPNINSFCSKTTCCGGDTSVDLTKHGLGYACKKGLKPEAPNQDSFLICIDDDEYSIYGVFDGHGRKGHDVSNFVKDMLPKLLAQNKDTLKDPISSLKEAFDKTQRLIEQATSIEQLDATRSGSTASVIMHDHKRRMLYIAHVGDSRCVLAKKDPSAATTKKMWQATDLTIDHKPNLPAEQARIEKHGGQVKFDGSNNYRVYAKGQRYPGLNMSRAMGDLLGSYHAGISAEPDVAERSIEGAAESEKTTWSRSQFIPQPMHTPSLSTHSIDPVHDKFLLLCSDGVWEFLTSLAAVQIVAQYSAQEAMIAAEQLANVSWDRWIQVMHGQVVDDITALIVHLDPSTP